MDPVVVKVARGPFMGVEGELRPGSETGTVTVCTITSPWTRRKAEVRADAIESLVAPSSELRCEIAWEHHDAGEDEKMMFWVERVDDPQNGLAAEWDAYAVHAAAVDAVTQRRTADALERFDQELARLNAADAAARADAELAYWRPQSASLARITPLQVRGEPDDITEEERLELAIAGLVRRYPSVWDLAIERRDAARQAVLDQGGAGSYSQAPNSPQSATDHKS
ncbi:hypothetical protein [Yinghuangia sp. YIM S09857]|uniref:hypothetical protein n=1 Tax=Yinghuangia sp. YIM S09857 TaxID=3436929 RepID=UPI003F52D860